MTPCKRRWAVAGRRTEGLVSPWGRPRATSAPWFSASQNDRYCSLPLYVFCGRHLLAAKLRKAEIDASAGAPQRSSAWSNAVALLAGLAKSDRLHAELTGDLATAAGESQDTGRLLGISCSPENSIYQVRFSDAAKARRMAQIAEPSMRSLMHLANLSSR